MGAARINFVKFKKARWATVLAAAGGNIAELSRITGVGRGSLLKVRDGTGSSTSWLRLDAACRNFEGKPAVRLREKLGDVIVRYGCNAKEACQLMGLATKFGSIVFYELPNVNAEARTKIGAEWDKGQNSKAYSWTESRPVAPPPPVAKPTNGTTQADPRVVSALAGMVRRSSEDPVTQDTNARVQALEAEVGELRTQLTWLVTKLGMFD